MKRAVLTAMFFCGVAALSGCPIYSHDDEGCFRDSDCANGYACDDTTGDCFLPGNHDSCTRPAQCLASQTCGRSGQCVEGDCTFQGCVRGYVCDSSTGTWACTLAASIGVGGAGGSSGDEGATAGAGAAGSNSPSAAGADASSGAAGQAGGG